MVLPQPAADAGGAQAWASETLGPLERLIARSEQGVLVLLHHAVPTRLGEVVRFFSPDPPWSTGSEVLRVCLEAAELSEVPAGSRVLLRVRAQDVAYLNVVRPLFTERRLRVVLWADEVTLDPLLGTAVDLVDWIGRTVAVPPRRWPAFSEQGVRAALGAEVPFAWDGSRAQLEALLADVGWTEGLVTLRADMSFRELLRQLEAPGLPVGEGIGRAKDGWRIRMALARAGREGSWVALQPLELPDGLRPLHARQADWDDATARLRQAGWEHAALMAAWVDLEPERIDEAVERGVAAPESPSAWAAEQVMAARAPTHVLRARIDDEDVRVERTEALLRNEDREDWTDEPHQGREARLVRYLAGLGDRVPEREAMDAAAALGLVDVAAELGRIRFERGADDQAHEVVQWLNQYGDVEQAVEIARTWAERARAADDDHSLGVAWSWLGDLLHTLGQAEQAQRYHEDSLALRRSSMAAEPGRAADPHNVFVSLLRLGDRQLQVGNHELAQRHYEDGLALAQELVDQEPGRTDHQRMLVSCYQRLGSLQRALGNAAQAARHYERGLAIAEALVAREPQRADVQRDLETVSINLGDLRRALGDAAGAQQYYERGLAIAETLVEREPGRTDFQQDRAAVYETLGDLQRALGNAERAREYYARGLAIVEQLAEREPGRLDLQGDLALAYERMAQVDSEHAVDWLSRAIDIHRARHQTDPHNAITQRELAVVLTQLGRLPGQERGLLREAYELLWPLRERGVLKDEYRDLADRLAEVIDAQ